MQQDDEDWLNDFDGCDPCQCDNISDENALNKEIAQYEDKHGKSSDWK